MQALDYWKAVTTDQSGFLDRIVALLSESGLRYCIIGGQAVNAYVEPVVSLDLDVALATGDLASAEALFSRHFKVERFAHSINVTAPHSDLRLQLQTDPRYAEFVERASRRDVLGLELPVAALEDVLQGKVWAAQDPTRRGSKRQKDLADIARLLEAYSELRARVPQEVLTRLI
jgi:nucleotidyltransferase AbiEii toxin of type IV toxin-antitoxin system